MEKRFTKLLLTRNLKLKKKKKRNLKLYIYVSLSLPLIINSYLQTSSNALTIIVIRTVGNNYLLDLLNNFIFKRHLRGHLVSLSSFRNPFSEIPDEQSSSLAWNISSGWDLTNHSLRNYLFILPLFIHLNSIY